MKPLYRVLLVEDNPGDVRLVQELLKDCGTADVELCQASSLDQSLQRLDANGFDAVLVDLGLPDSQGIETFERIHTRFPDVPTIVLTGNEDVDLAIRSVQAGAQDYLLKSEINGSPLIRAIQYAIERKKAEEALRRSEATLRSFYENSPMLMGTIELTDEGHIIHISDNPVSSRFLSVPYESTSGRDARELGVPEDVISIWSSHYRRSLELGRPVSFEYFHESPQQQLWLSVHVAPIGSGPSGRVQFCYLAEDVTERKLSDEAARKHATELQRSNAELQRFNRLSIGRELRMVELKQEVNSLLRDAGKPHRYPLDFLDDEGADLISSQTPKRPSDGASS